MRSTKAPVKDDGGTRRRKTQIAHVTRMARCPLCSLPFHGDKRSLMEIISMIAARKVRTLNTNRQNTKRRFTDALLTTLIPKSCAKRAQLVNAPTKVLLNLAKIFVVNTLGQTALTIGPLERAYLKVTLTHKGRFSKLPYRSPLLRNRFIILERNRTQHALLRNWEQKRKMRSLKRNAPQK